MIPAPRRSRAKLQGALRDQAGCARQIDAVEVLSTPDHPSDRLAGRKVGFSELVLACSFTLQPLDFFFVSRTCGASAKVKSMTSSPVTVLM